MNVANVGIMPQTAQQNSASSMTSSFMQGFYDTVKMALQMKNDNEQKARQSNLDAQDAAYNQARTGLINSQIQEYRDNASAKQAIIDYFKGHDPHNPQPSESSGGLFNTSTPSAVQPASPETDTSGGSGLFNSQPQMSMENPIWSATGHGLFTGQSNINSFMQGFYDTTKSVLQMARDKQAQTQSQPQMQAEATARQPQTPQPETPSIQQPEDQSSSQFSVEQAQKTLMDMTRLTGDPSYYLKAIALTPEHKYGTADIYNGNGTQTYITIDGKPDMAQPVGTVKPDKHTYHDAGYGRIIDENGKVINVPVKPDKPDKASYGHIWIPSQDGKSKQLYQTVNGKPVAALGGKVPMSNGNNRPLPVETAIYNQIVKNRDKVAALTTEQNKDPYSNAAGFDNQKLQLKNENKKLISRLQQLGSQYQWGSYPSETPSWAQKKTSKAAYKEGTKARNKQTGETLVYHNGTWVKQ